MPAYDHQTCSPPAPIAEITLRSQQTQAIVANVRMLLDTGADVTLVPRSAVNEIGVVVIADQQYELIGFDGSRSFADVVILDLIFERKVFRGKYLLSDDPVGIIGRDILNNLAVKFDGPELDWSVVK